jgi:hypothetical protein
LKVKSISYCALIFVLLGSLWTNFNVYVYGQEAVNTPTTTKVVSHNIKEGQWVRYNPPSIDIKSNNKFFELIAKAVIGNKTQGLFANLTSNSTSSIKSLQGIEWIGINVTKVSGDQITTITEIKLHGKAPIISRPVVRNIPVNGNIAKGESIPFFALPADVKVGDRFSSIQNNGIMPSSVVVNRTLQKTIGGHNIEVYELIGKQNAYNQTTGAASETSATMYYDKQTGIPLEFSFGIDLGIFFGTVSANIRFSAIDWSNRVGS